MLLLFLSLGTLVQSDFISVNDLRVNRIPATSRILPFSDEKLTKLFPKYEWEPPVIDWDIDATVLLSFEVEANCIPQCRGLSVADWHIELMKSKDESNISTFSSAEFKSPFRKVEFSIKVLEPNNFYQFRAQWEAKNPFLNISNTLHSGWSEWGEFRTGPKASDWDEAKWIASNNVATAPYFIKTLDVPEGAKHLQAHISGLGFYRAWVDGDLLFKAGEVLQPGWTDYNVRAPFCSHTIPVEEKSTVEIIVLLGEAYRDGKTWPRRDGAVAGDDNERVLRAIFAFDDEKASMTLTDETWETFPSCVELDHVYNGLTVNFSLNGGECWPPFSSITTEPVIVTKFGPGSDVKMRVTVNPPVTYHGVESPVETWLNANGTIMFVDFGTNVAAHTVIDLSQVPVGTTLNIKHAEVKQHPPYGPMDGSLYYGNLRKAKAMLTYTSNGQQTNFAPIFTYMGFRYIEIGGLPSSMIYPKSGKSLLDVAKNLVFRVQVHARVQPVSSFKSSNPTLDTVNVHSVRSQMVNLMNVPTDCDQRDERLGWLGDTSLTSDSFVQNFDVASFLTTWLEQVEESMKDGALPDVVPWYLGGHRPGDASWVSAFPSVLNALHNQHNTPDLLRKHWDGLMQFVDGLEKQCNPNITTINVRYGDWCPPYGQSSHAKYSGEFSYLMILSQILNFAKIIGDTGNTTRLEAIFDKRSSEFFEANENSSFLGNQLGLSLALTVPGLFNDKDREVHVNALVAEVKKSYHMDVGIIGAKFLFPVLAKFGQTDLALTMITQPTYPSYAYMFENPYENATGMWELLDAPTSGPGMNSRNHHMFSSVSHFIISTVGGLSKQGSRYYARPGKSRSEVTWAQTTLGGASLFWEVQRYHRSSLHFKIDIPMGYTGEVRFPRWLLIEKIVEKLSGEIWNLSEGLKKSDFSNGILELIMSPRINRVDGVRVGFGHFEFQLHGPVTKKKFSRKTNKFDAL